MRLAEPDDIVRHILAWSEQGAIGLVFDYDGTLAEIAPRPEAAHISDETREQLLRLAHSGRAHVALITGRSLESLLEVAGPLTGLTLATNGGLRITEAGREWIQPDAAALVPDLQALIEELKPIVARWPGAFIEDKRLSFTVHFRLAEEAGPELTRLVSKAVSRSGGRLRMLPGKMSVEVQPNVAWDKGRALTTLLDQWNVGSRAAFFGDDTIDEPAFVALRERGGLTCCIVSEHRPTAAEFLLPGVREMNVVLRALSDSLSPKPS